MEITFETTANFRMLTGHEYLQAYLHRFGLADDALSVEAGIMDIRLPRAAWSHIKNRVMLGGSTRMAQQPYQALDQTKLS